MQALAVVHQKGLVHRDLKPSNILVAEDGRCKLTDFVVGADWRARTEVATTDPNRCAGQLLHRSADLCRDHPGQGTPEEQGKDAGEECLAIGRLEAAAPAVECKLQP